MNISTPLENSETIVSNGIPIGVILLDPDYRIIHWNDWLVHKSGLTRERMIGRNFFEAFPEVVRRDKDKYIRGCVERRKSCVLSTTFHQYLISLEVVRGNKSMRMFQKATIYPPASYDGTAGEIAAVILIEDLTDQLLYSNEIQEREAKYRGIFENVPNPILVIDPSQVILDCNQGAGRILGHGREQIRGRSFPSLFLAEDLDRLEKYWETVLVEKTSGSAKFRMICKDERIIEVQVDSSAVFDHAGQIGQLLVIIEDITGKTRMEREISKLEKLATVSTLAGGIAHDFNNLLTVIMGNIDLCLDEFCTRGDECPELTDAARACRRASELAREYILFSEFGALNPDLVDLKLLIGRAAESLNIRPNIHFQAGFLEGPVKIRADEMQLREVFFHILKNAKEAQPEGGVIRAGVEKIERKSPELTHNLLDDHKDYVRVEIIDKGVGIAREHIRRLFDPYFSTKKLHSQKGMGLGLTIALAIARRHGGTVTLESVYGKGTTVYIYIPMNL